MTTEKEMRDIAMEIATGNVSTISVDYETFMSDNFDISYYAWEPFAHYPQESYNDLVMGEYEVIFNALRRI